jgi:cell shape-determining protein MreD
MKFLCIFCSFFLIPLLQGSFFNVIVSPSFFSPNIAIFISLIWILLRGFNESVLWILLLGVVYDSILSFPFGLMTLFLLISGYGFSLFARQVLVNGRIIGKIVISSYVIISLFCYYSMIYFSKTFSLFEILSFIQKDSFFSIVYSLAIFWTLYRIAKIFVRKQESIPMKKMKFL